MSDPQTKPKASPAKKKTDADSDKPRREDGKSASGDSLNTKRKPEKSVDVVVREVDARASDSKKLKNNEGKESKWTEKDEDDDDETKWNYLEHKGVIFPPFYEYRNFTVLYQGRPITLNRNQEEMAYYWAQSLGSDWETKEHYRNNFAKIFCGSFDRRLGYTKLENFDFSSIVNYIAEQKEIKKNKTKEEKLAEKQVKQARDDFYGFALVDNDREKIGGYAIEPPTLFKGRGKHPKAGFMKARILPEDLTINIAGNAPVPKCDMPGHCWKGIVHNNQVTWLAFYKDDTINTTYKYIFLAASSKFKGLSDRKKYDKARKLKDCIDSVRRDYQKKIRDKNKQERQLGTAAYLIDVLALRVGNEKSEDEADTVGCCSLRVEHIQVLPNNQITLDFLGKDSMRYFNTVTVDEQVWKNLEGFIKGKDKTENLFDSIDASVLNDYLRSLMTGLTAKVFRTYNASFTLERELKKKDVSGLELEDKLAWYNEANRQVAILCNHQKTVSKTFDVSVEKQKLKIDDMKEYLEQLKTHQKNVKKGKEGFDEDKIERQVLKKLKEAGNEEKVKPIKRKFPSDPDRASDHIEKLEKKIISEEKKLVEREENKAIALGTSKLNYNDPRITVKWCKENEVPIEKVFPRTVRSKFPWAMYTELDWAF